MNETYNLTLCNEITTDDKKYTFYNFKIVDITTHKITFHLRLNLIS